MSRLAAVAMLAVVLLTMLVVPGAGAQERDSRAAEVAAAALEGILGAPADDIIVVRNEHATSYEVRLDEEQAARMRQNEAAKNQQLLTAGRALSKPSSTSSIITGATLACSFGYYFWWSYVNLDSGARTVKVTHDLKGPGQRFKSTFNHSFTGNSVAVVVPNETHEIGAGNTGVYTHQAKGAGLGGTGKTKLRYVATGTGC